MSSEISPELRALVEQGIIDEAQAAEAMRSAPAADEFEGFARCMTVGCEMREADRPLRLRAAHMRVMAPDLPVVTGQTTHIEVVDDADLACPECGVACAILPTRPPTYQPMMPA